MWPYILAGSLVVVLLVAILVGFLLWQRYGYAFRESIIIGTLFVSDQRANLASRLTVQQLKALLKKGAYQWRFYLEILQNKPVFVYTWGAVRVFPRKWSSILMKWCISPVVTTEWTKAPNLAKETYGYQISKQSSSAHYKGQFTNMYDVALVF